MGGGCVCMCVCVCSIIKVWFITQFKDILNDKQLSQCHCLGCRTFLFVSLSLSLLYDRQTTGNGSSSNNNKSVDDVEDMSTTLGGAERGREKRKSGTWVVLNRMYLKYTTLQIAMDHVAMWVRMCVCMWLSMASGLVINIKIHTHTPNWLTDNDISLACL